jgi:hypothetical protein
MSGTPRADESHSFGTVLLLVLLAVALLAGPLWVEVAHFDDTTYRYERAEVTQQGGTIGYAADAADPGVAISEAVACSGPIDTRACHLERGLIGNRTAPTSRFTSGNVSGEAVESPYRFVAGSEAVYRVDAVLNRSQGYVVDEGSVRPVDEDSDSTDRTLYRVELALEPVSPATVLDRISADVGDVAPPIREAARTGDVRRYASVDAPVELVRLDDGTIYRVYLAAKSGPPEDLDSVVFLLRYLAPLAGLVLGYRVLVTDIRSRIR